MNELEAEGGLLCQGLSLVVLKIFSIIIGREYSSVHFTDTEIQYSMNKRYRDQ